MGTFVNNGNINWDGNWQTTSKVDVLHASTNLNVDNGVTQYSGYWTGAASHTNLGVLIYLATLTTPATGRTITATLQSSTDTDFTSPTDVQSGTYVTASGTNLLTWLYIKLAATAAEDSGTPLYYRYKFVTDNAADTGLRADNAATTKVAIVQVLNETGTLAAGDETLVVGAYTQTSGNSDAGTVTVNISSATVYGRIRIGNGGVLSWKTDANTKLCAQSTTPNWHTVYKGGTWTIGTSAARIGAAYTAEFVQSNTASSYVFVYGKFYMYGNIPTYYKTSLASNIAANAVQFSSTDSTGWAVGDEIVVTPTGTSLAEMEKVVITGISGTTIYIDSNGNGTAATPKFTYGHTTTCPAHVVNITRNCKITSANAAYDNGARAYQGVATDFIISWGSVKNYRGGFAYCGWNEGTAMHQLEGAVISEGSGDFSANGNGVGHVANSYSVKDTTVYLGSLGSMQITGGVEYTNVYILNTTAAAFGVATYVYNWSGPSFALVTNVQSFGGGLYFGGDAAQQIIVKNSTLAFGSYGFYANGVRIQMENCKVYGNTAAFFGNGRGGLSIVYDIGSIYGSDGVTTVANTYFMRANDGGYSFCNHYYYGSQITLVGSIGWGTSYYSPASIIKFSSSTAGRFVEYKPYYGTNSDQIFGGQAAGWANGGAGTCLLMNPSTTTRALEYEFLIPVEAGASVALSFFVKKTSSAANPTLFCTIYDSDDGTTKLIDAASVTLTDTWAQFTSAAFTPTNKGFCRVVLSALDGATTGDIGVDDISVA